MLSFEELSKQFAQYFNVRHFPTEPATLYEADEYFLSLGGKRVRPVMCLMGNELFDEINKDAWPVATAIELFHNFTLIHDDIMDKAPLRRNQPTVHAKYGESTALLSGDVMLIVAYDYLNKISTDYLHKIITLFNRTAKEVCEGQQLDMDFEKQEVVKMDEYIRMIELKTSVLLAASLQLGAILGGAGQNNQEHIYDFGRNLGIAFQIQDDYLDAYGDPAKFGKQPGGDIMANKKTFLMIKALESANATQLKELKRLMQAGSTSPEDKVAGVLSVFDDCGVNKWAANLKEKYITEAFEHLEEMAVIAPRKEPLRELAHFLVQREH
jgi:geranylgeranyl diphosphate synthase type II